MSPSPLDGVRVLDLSRLLPGPACTWYLMGLGARVDRVEPPGGDYTRHVPPFADGTGVFFAALHQGKRSIVVDLRAEPERIAQLVSRYDVLVEGFRPGVMEAMGLGPDVLLAANPALVYARISGFGQDGPWAQRPGHDLNYVGIAGHLTLASLHGDAPTVPGVQVADFAAAQTAAMGICAALVGRAAGQGGRVLDISLAEAALPLVAPYAAAGAQAVVPPGSGLLQGGLPSYGTFRCADGRYLTLGALEPKFQAEVTARVGGFAGREDLARTFLTEPRAHWVALLEQACAGEALAPDEVGHHPQHVARRAVDTVAGTTFVRPPLMPRDRDLGPVPTLGQHTGEILAEAGLGPEHP